MASLDECAGGHIPPHIFTHHYRGYIKYSRKRLFDYSPQEEMRVGRCKREEGGKKEELAFPLPSPK